MQNIPDFSIVFPILNQADHIEKVIRSFHKELTRRGFSFELIGVVNCTTDNSFAICRKLAQDYSNVSAYELKGCGYGLGILYGFKKAKGKYLCYCNSARTHTPDLVRALRHFVIEDSVLVHGVRLKRESTKRGLGSLLYNVFCRVIFRIPNRDINGNPNIFSREMYNQLQLQSTDSMVDLELLEKAKKLRIPVVEVPVFDYSRHGGRSTSSIKTIFRLMKEVMRYWGRTRLSSSS